jgi:hypothetical protein
MVDVNGVDGASWRIKCEASPSWIDGSEFTSTSRDLITSQFEQLSYMNSKAVGARYLPSRLPLFRLVS